jgi:hypothetical protein
MSAPAPDSRAAAVRAALEAALGGDATPPDPRGVSEDALDDVVAGFADEHAAAALPVLTRLAGAGSDRGLRRAARRALYRLAQRGVEPPPPAAPRPVVERRGERATRAWLSGVDGSGSRAAWIVFEGTFGGLRLCSVILNDSLGITDVAGGDITRKRLDRELAGLRASQKLPWVETDPARAVGLVAEALALHTANGTSPPPGFAPWRAAFASAAIPEPPALPDAPDPAQLEQSAALLDRPELAGWFLDPESVQSDAVELLQTRESRLVLSDQLKAEREAAIVDHVIERELDGPARRVWARRLAEMALVLDGAGSPEPAALARNVAGALAAEGFEPRRVPFVRALAARSLEIAGEVTLGRLSASEVSRKPKAP